jgi:hypothetical protein
VNIDWRQPFGDFSSYDWRLLLATKMWLRAKLQPGLSDEQRKEALRHAANLEAVHKNRLRRGQLPKPPSEPRSRSAIKIGPTSKGHCA